jgi:restriction system protein
MPVPDYQTLMLPLLEYLADGSTRRTVPDVTGHLAAHFHLSEEDLDQRLPSGVQPTFYNRTHWAVTYLAKAGVLARVARVQVAITDRGKQVIASKPERVDVAFLRRYPEFEEFRTKTRSHEPTERPDDPAPANMEQNPEELLYGTYASLRRAVEADLLDRLPSDGLSWEFFEQVVVDVLSRMGFGSNVEDTGRRVTRKSGDDGIDGVIDEDRLGLDAVYIQAKRYGAKNPVGRPALQAFNGSLDGQRASKGVFITTSYFTAEAEDYVRRISKRIVLIDGKTLARHMYEHGVGVRTRRTLDVKRVDEVYFEGDV